MKRSAVTVYPCHPWFRVRRPSDELAHPCGESSSADFQGEMRSAACGFARVLSILMSRVGPQSGWKGQVSELSMPSSLVFMGRFEGRKFQGSPGRGDQFCSVQTLSAHSLPWDWPPRGRRVRLILVGSSRPLLPMPPFLSLQRGGIESKLTSFITRTTSSWTTWVREGCPFTASRLDLPVGCSEMLSAWTTHPISQVCCKGESAEGHERSNCGSLLSRDGF